MDITLCSRDDIEFLEAVVCFIEPEQREEFERITEEIKQLKGNSMIEFNRSTQTNVLEQVNGRSFFNEQGKTYLSPKHVEEVTEDDKCTLIRLKNREYYIPVAESVSEVNRLVAKSLVGK